MFVTLKLGTVPLRLHPLSTTTLKCQQSRQQFASQMLLCLLHLVMGKTMAKTIPCTSEMIRTPSHITKTFLFSKWFQQWAQQMATQRYIWLASVLNNSSTKTAHIKIKLCLLDSSIKMGTRLVNPLRPKNFHTMILCGIPQQLLRELRLTSSSHSTVKTGKMLGFLLVMRHTLTIMLQHW